MHPVLTVTVMSLSLVAALVGGPATSSSDPYRRILELEQARSLGDGELAGYLASPDDRVATRAALAVGRTRLPGGASLLVAHVADPRVPVRAMSIYGLGLIAQGTASAEIVAALKDPSGAVRIAALDALGRYRAARMLQSEDGAAAREIVRTLATDADPIVRSRAAITLVYFAEDGPISTVAENHLVMRFSNERDASVRTHIMWAIFRGYSKSVAREFVMKALHDPDENVRTEAVRTYARWDDPETIATVTTLLHDPSWHVQEQAMIVLRHLRKEPPITQLTEIPSYVKLPKIPVDPFASTPAQPRTPSNGKLQAASAADASFEPKILPFEARDMVGPASGPHPRVRIVTTKGNLYLALFPEWAPMSVANFLNTANAGYYDGNFWFRVVPNFVVQTGDPSPKGDTVPSFTVGAEENPLEQRPFILSLGMEYNERSMPERDSGGTQYYITLSPQFHLDQDFTVFGDVISGSEVLAHLTESDRVVRVERLPDIALP